MASGKVCETERKEYFDSLRQTALFSPRGNTKYDSVLLQVLEKNYESNYMALRVI